jgi:hypothetical protein
MQKWEYCAVFLYSGVIAYYTDQGRREDNTFAVVEKAIAFLGEQGWEAFAVVEEDISAWYFKRPKP